MKKIVTLLLLLSLLLSSCASSTENLIPLVRRNASSITLVIRSLGGYAVGTDGKLYMYGDLYENSGNLSIRSQKVPLTERQFHELPDVIKNALETDNRYELVGLYNWHFISENVVDVWEPGPLYYLKSNGELWAVHDDFYTTPGVPVLVAENVSVICRTYPVSFILNTGELIVYDSDDNYIDIEGAQRLTGVSGHKLTKIAENARDAANAGSKTFLYLDAHGQVWVRGYNDFGLLANGKFDPVFEIDYLKKEEMGTPISPDKYSVNKFYKAIDDAKKVFCDFKNIFVIRNDNSLWGWGANEFGQVGVGSHGDGDSSTRDVIAKPKKVLENVIKIENITSGSDYYVARNSFMALTSDGCLYAWGDNYNACLGNGEYGADKNMSNAEIIEQGLFADKPTLVMSGVQEYSSSSIAACRFYLVLTNKGEVFSWGNTTNGAVGNGIKAENRGSQREYIIATPTKILDNVKSIGTYITASALKNDGAILAWGYNPFGWLLYMNQAANTPQEDITYLATFATPTKSPYISAVISDDGTVSFVPTPTE